MLDIGGLPVEAKIMDVDNYLGWPRVKVGVEASKAIKIHRKELKHGKR